MSSKFMTRYLFASSVCLMAVACGAHAETKADTTTVTVTGQRADVSNRIDRKVYRTGKDLQSTTGSAADVLNSVPSVSVDGDGNVSVRGDSKVTILIDGKPATQFAGASGGDGLQQLPADSIDAVEIITNPSAQYDPNGAAGIINIVTKKGRTPGWSGAGTLSAGDKQRYFVSTSAGLKRGRLTLNGAVSFRQDDRLRKVAGHRLTGQGATVADETLQEHMRRDTPSLSGSADYQIDDRNTIGVNASHAERKGDRFFTQHNTALASGVPVSDTWRYSDGHEWRLDAAQGAHFDTKPGRDGETLSFGVQRSVTRERERYAYLNHHDLPPGPDSRDRLNLSLDLVTTEISADYVLPFGDRGTLKAGYRFHRDDNRYDNSGDTLDTVSGLYVTDPDITNHFRYRQAIHAAYVTWQGRYGAWDMIAGLRAEDVRVRTVQITGNLTNLNRYGRLYPSLHLQRALSDATRLTLSYSRRVSRPDPEELNPFSDHQDIHNLRAGNPNLRPQDTQAFEAGVASDKAGVTTSATAYVRLSKDVVTDVTQVIDPQTVLATKENLPKSRAAGLEFAASGKAGKVFTYNISGNLVYTEIDARALGTSGLKSSTGLNLKASFDYRPTKDDDAQVSVSRTDRRLTPQGELAAVNIVNLGYRHQVTPRLAVVATVNDLLNGQKMIRHIVTPALDDTFSRQQVGQAAYLSLAWTFGGGRKKAASFDYDQGN